MIEPNRKPAKIKKITTYDFEWNPETYEITLCGAYDERGYRWYTSVEHFILGELTPENAGRTYYAHFGGASDMIFLLRPFLKDTRYSVRAIFSGSSAILVHIEKGAFTWQFVDSYWTLRVPLWKIGEWLGFPKLKIDFDKCTQAELITYNERDNEILFKAMNSFQESILLSGGELGITAASTSMKCFLRKYLKKPINNAQRFQDFARQGYTASRVEDIRRTCDRANYYDINSSFPFSMTMPCPGSPLGRCDQKRLPDSGLYMAEVSTYTPEDEYLPALPHRYDGRVFYPTGPLRTVVTQDDVLAGGFKIKKVHKVVRYEDRDDLRAFAHDFYTLRKRGSGFESEVYKIVLNSLYR